VARTKVGVVRGSLATERDALDIGEEGGRGARAVGCVVQLSANIETTLNKSRDRVRDSLRFARLKSDRVAKPEATTGDD
jgi:hypothetical protein